MGHSEKTLTEDERRDLAEQKKYRVMALMARDTKKCDYCLNSGMINATDEKYWYCFRCAYCGSADLWGLSHKNFPAWDVSRYPGLRIKVV